MKNSVKTLVTLSLSLLALLCSCQLAAPDGMLIPESDRLIGVLITQEPLGLFDEDQFTEDNLEALVLGYATTNPDRYTSRLYARRVDSPDPLMGEQTYRYDFDVESSISFFGAHLTTEGGEDYIASSYDPCVGNVSLKCGETEGLSGTVHLTSGGFDTIRVNPVYQSQDGSVYCVAGEAGYTRPTSDTPGVVYSEKLTNTSTVTENGVTTQKNTVIEVSFETVIPAEQITILQMSADHTVLTKQNYTPTQLPEKLTPDVRTAYIITETTDANKQHNRVLYARNDTALSAYITQPNGTGAPATTTLIWP